MAVEPNITELLNTAHSGDAAASDAAYALLYRELHTTAERQLRGLRPGATLNSTALVHETYLRLNQHYAGEIHNRVHFFALAARAMRQIIVDHARRRNSAKRGGKIWHTGLDQALDLPGDDMVDRSLELDAALRALEARDPRLSRVVEWHFFGGLSHAEIATELHQDERAVRNDWDLARAFLKREMDSPSP